MPYLILAAAVSASLAAVILWFQPNKLSATGWTAAALYAWAFVELYAAS